MKQGWLRIFVVLCVFILGCEKAVQETSLEAQGFGLRAMTSKEAVADFNELSSLFRELYGPLEFKEDRFQFQFEDWVKTIRKKVAAAKSDTEALSLYAEFLSRFQDAHVGFRFPLNSSGAQTYNIPIFVTPIANSFLVDWIAPGVETRIQKGDELVSIDGKAPEDLLKIILKYKALGTPESNRHWILKVFNRDFFIPELIPTNNMARVVVKRADGKLITEDLIWKIVPVNPERFVQSSSRGWMIAGLEEMQEAAGLSMMGMAKPTPFFANPEVLKKYGLQIVTADASYRAKYGLKPTDQPNIFAAMYRYQGKNILLVRNYIYQHSDYPNATYLQMYKAILDQWEGMTDVLVLDQTHNGGGSYCEEFFRLFIQEEKDAFVQSMNVDRKWIQELSSGSWAREVGESLGVKLNSFAFASFGAEVEAAYDRGEKMSRPLPIIGGSSRISPADYTWKKPMLVLVDELSASCGDAFPALIQANSVAKLFGARTMGAGGNVEAFTLTRSRAQVNFTRGLFTIHRMDGKYTKEMWVENNGVTPEISYIHTVEDYRNHFLHYVKTFSDAALAQIPPDLTH